MTRRDRERRLARMDALAVRKRTAAEEAEYDRLVTWRDGIWRRLPSTIDNARHRLADLQSWADRLGRGPC